MLRMLALGISLACVAMNCAYADPNTVATPAAATSGSFVNGTVAIVNTEVITSQELSDATDQAIAQAKAQNLSLPDRQTIERQVLQGMIMQKIALQLAKLNNISITPDELNAALQQVAEQHKVSVSAMYQKLTASGVNLDSFKTSVQNQLIIQKLEQAAVASSIVITPNQINNYLADKARSENANTEYDIQHILIALPSNPTADDYAATKERANMVLDKIKGGLAFSQAAMTYSDSSDALNGGDLGYKTLASLPESFVSAVTSMQVGQVSDLISSDSGYNIIKLVDKKGTIAQQNYYVNEYHVEAILIKLSPIMSSAQAQALLNRLRTALVNGKPFAEVAQANSQDPIASQNGGNMGWINLINVDPVLAAQIRTLPKDTLSQPFQTAQGWYLIKVSGARKVNDTVNYQREQARQALFMIKANEALQAWQSQIRGGSYIKILDPNLQMPNS
jgi:peptidyl-prolyl cis-trans isomerase SurA